MLRLVFYLGLLGLLPQLGAQVLRPVPSLSYPSIQAAINAAQDGDIVDIAAGTYFEELLISGKGLTIRGQGPGVTIIDGQLIQRGVVAHLPAGALLKFEMLSIVAGATQGSISVESDHQGGGIYVADALTSLDAATIELSHCRVENCRAANGGGLYAGLHHQLLLNFCEFRNNGPGASYASMVALPSGFGILSRGDITATDSIFEANVAGAAANGAGVGGAIRIEASAAQGGFLLNVKRSQFINNVAIRGAGISAVSQMGVGGLPGSVLLENCALVGNGSSAPTAKASAVELSWTDIWSRSSLFAKNINTQSPDLIAGARRLELIHCTIADNGPQTAMAANTTALCSYSSIGNIRNSLIVRNHAGQVFQSLGGASPPSIVTSLIEGPTIPGVPHLDLGFVNSAAYDYSLQATSPAVDQGTALYGGGLDLFGLPRFVGTQPDIGCFELQTAGPAPGTNGTVTDSMGQPIDVLMINGSSGNNRRVVTLQTSSMLTIEVNQPPTSAAPANFILWGRLGVPAPSELFSIYFAGGDMAFAPAIVAPGNPLLFTLTNSYEPPPSSGVIASTPTPWAASGFALAQPTTMTLQGLIETGGGNVRITNAVILNSY